KLVRRINDGAITTTKIGDDIAQQFLVDRIEPRCRFIKDHILRLVQQRDNDLELLLVSLREFLDVPAFAAGKIEATEPVLGTCAGRAFVQVVKATEVDQ